MTRIGVIADDFTGATDVAAAYVRRGHRAVVLIEDAPAPDALADAEVIVVALKTRTAPIEDAVADSLTAARRLEEFGAEQLYLKYCSTFDSTDRGNIGPVLDMLLARTGAEHVVVVPAFPDNGRTVVDGLLRIDGELLERTPMRHHPLTPMTRSRVSELLAPQTGLSVGEIPLATVRAGAAALALALETASERYLVVDAETDDDLAVIAASVAGHPLISGAAGLALGAARGHAGAVRIDAPAGRRLVVCGSASARTREQIAHAEAAGLPCRQLSLAALAADPGSEIDGALSWLAALDDDSIPVIYSVGDLADVAVDDPQAAERVEHALSEIVRRSLESGVRRVITAGGETSGSVVRALGIGGLRLGQPIAPGVSWAAAETRPDGIPIAIALKSGNFGAPDMFSTAWGELA